MEHIERHIILRIGAISPTPISPTRHLAYLLPFGAISPTNAKCDQNNVKQLKQTVQVYKVKGMVQKRSIKK